MRRGLWLSAERLAGALKRACFSWSSVCLGTACSTPPRPWVALRGCRSVKLPLVQLLRRSPSAAVDAEARVAVGEERATPLELLFDLVFVYAITQMAHLISADPTPEGFARGAVVLATVWYAWICFAWLTNNVGVDDGIVRGGVLAAAGASFLAALAVPHALDSEVLLFVVAYFVVRVLHVVLYAYGTRDAPAVRRNVLAIAPTFVLGPAALFALPWLPEGWRLPYLLVALALDVSSPYVSGVAELPVRPAHFAERFALFVIITLGESIVSIGVGAGAHPHGAVLIAVALAFVLAVLLWWAYFDVVSTAAERRLGRAARAERAILARDAYTYIHYVIVAGIVGFAVGCKKLVADPTHHLATADAVALCGGVAIYLLGHALFRLRMTRTIGRHHLAGAAASAALIFVSSRVPALAVAGLLVVVLAAAAAWERLERADRCRHQAEAVADTR
jgi:low temperature requirement protein LtrA